MAMRVMAGFLVLLVYAGAAAASGKPPKDMTVKDIQACMDANFVNRGALRDLHMKVTDREGKSHELRMRLFWKPAGQTRPRMNLRVVDPVAIRGSSYLLVIGAQGEEVYFSLPNADRALRITGRNMTQPLWGTDFSYAEIRQVVGVLLEGSTLRGADSEVGKRPAFTVETEVVPEDTGYRRIVSHVDQKTCVLMKTEFFAKPGAPRKVLEADPASLLSADKYWLVLKYTMRDLREGSQTELEMSDFSIMERLPERLFEPTRFFEPYQ